MSLSETSQSLELDNLFAGHIQPVVAGAEQIASGQGVLVRGTVLGKVTASKKCVIVDSTGDDGSQSVYAILAESVDATSSDVQAPVYYTGEYNINELVFGGDDTYEDHQTQARNIGIFFKDVVSK